MLKVCSFLIFLIATPAQSTVHFAAHVASELTEAWPLVTKADIREASYNLGFAEIENFSDLILKLKDTGHFSARRIEETYDRVGVPALKEYLEKSANSIGDRDHYPLVSNSEWELSPEFSYELWEKIQVDFLALEEETKRLFAIRFHINPTLSHKEVFEELAGRFNPDELEWDIQSLYRMNMGNLAEQIETAANHIIQNNWSYIRSADCMETETLTPPTAQRVDVSQGTFFTRPAQTLPLFDVYPFNFKRR